jgi:hypothetical protein
VEITRESLDSDESWKQEYGNNPSFQTKVRHNEIPKHVLFGGKRSEGRGKSCVKFLLDDVLGVLGISYWTLLKHEKSGKVNRHDLNSIIAYIRGKDAKEGKKVEEAIRGIWKG